MNNTGTYRDFRFYLVRENSFKNAIRRAVEKASPLPEAPDKLVFDREIIFHFRVN